MSGAPSWQRPEAVGRVWAQVAGALMLAAFGVAAAGSLFYPFGRDQGILLKVCSEAINRTLVKQVFQFRNFYRIISFCYTSYGGIYIFEVFNVQVISLIF